jgi:hypothetical protein
MAVLAPIPNANESAAVAVNSGFAAMARKAYLRSWSSWSRKVRDRMDVRLGFGKIVRFVGKLKHAPPQVG